MELITTEEAEAMVAGFEDGLGKKVDPNIVTALTQFVRVTEALGFKTFQSCEGHIDWGFPYPWIEFEVSNERISMPSRWKFWLFLRRRWMLKENEKHTRNAEKKVDQLCAMFTHFLLLYDQMHNTSPETFLVIVRGHPFRFRLMPARRLLFDSYKASGNLMLLGSLLEEQRSIFKSFASFCVETLKREHNLVGIPDEGCRGCMGRG